MNAYNGSTVHIRLWWREASGPWKFDDYTCTAATSDSPNMISPIAGTDVNGTPITFNWDAGDASVSFWWLKVGTVFDGNNIHDSGLFGELTVDVPLPADGSTVHVTLWYWMDGQWNDIRYKYSSLP